MTPYLMDTVKVLITIFRLCESGTTSTHSAGKGSVTDRRVRQRTQSVFRILMFFELFFVFKCFAAFWHFTFPRIPIMDISNMTIYLIQSVETAVTILLRTYKWSLYI